MNAVCFFIQNYKRKTVIGLDSLTMKIYDFVVILFDILLAANPNVSVAVACGYHTTSHLIT